MGRNEPKPAMSIFSSSACITRQTRSGSRGNGCSRRAGQLLGIICLQVSVVLRRLQDVWTGNLVGEVQSPASINQATTWYLQVHVCSKKASTRRLLIAAQPGQDPSAHVTVSTPSSVALAIAIPSLPLSSRIIDPALTYLHFRVTTFD